MDDFAKDLWDMKLLESKKSKDGLWTITRVQGGWLYMLTRGVTGPVFVPLDNEFIHTAGA